MAYDSLAASNLGFGGEFGLLSPQCPNGFTAVGRACINFPVQAATAHADMDSVCKQSFGEKSVPYTPTDHIQNAIVQSLLRKKNVSI